MATEYRFENKNGAVITTKDAATANEYRLRPGFTEVKDQPKKNTADKKD